MFITRARVTGKTGPDGRRSVQCPSINAPPRVACGSLVAFRVGSRFGFVLIGFVDGRVALNRVLSVTNELGRFVILSGMMLLWFTIRFRYVVAVRSCLRGRVGENQILTRYSRAKLGSECFAA
jgi:hypothetical protein